MPVAPQRSRTPRAARARLRPVNIRRGVQLLVLTAFVASVAVARAVVGAAPSPLLGVFFDLDPLILVTTTLATRALEAALLLALATLLVTVTFGRVFCGWFCPLGTLHAIASRITRRFRRRQTAWHWSRWHLSKYWLLVALAALAAFRVQALTLLDPFVILYRTTVTALIPAAQSAVEAGADGVYQADPRVGRWRLTTVSEPPARWLREHVFVRPGQSFIGGGGVFAFLAVILGLNVLRPRFWCRYVCPLGALLGLVARRPLLRRRVAEGNCNDCDLCGMTCHSGATAGARGPWLPQECFGCLNCTDSCTREGVRFEWSAPWRSNPQDAKVNLSRRGVLVALAGGAAGALALRASPQARGQTFAPALIRPPGARAEPDFLSRCVACGLCMKICPTGGLQPAWTEAGFEGLWTPRLVPRIGDCDYECKRCGDVCPTAAIRRLPLDEKKRVRIGLAIIDTTRCIPYAFGRECTVCEEHCPIPEKAIYLVPAAAPLRDMDPPSAVDAGNRPPAPSAAGIAPGDPSTSSFGRGAPREAIVRQPRVDPARCIGCGACERSCPFADEAAIRVVSANESRHEQNQPFLE
ncbi:MAG: hypothetical protein CHACPFDD_04188 [Phycisphaerae bacterium]|nr:hypothetical protein [Phycisphaerae bacterium]